MSTETKVVKAPKKRSQWREIVKNYPEILERLRFLVNDSPSFTASQFAQILNEEFTEQLTALGVKISPQHLRNVLTPTEKQFTAVNGKITVGDLAEQEKSILLLLKKAPQTISGLAEHLKIPKEDIFPVIDGLRLRGYDVVVEQGVEQSRVVLRREPAEGELIILPPITKRSIKFLVLSDLCLGLKSQQSDLLATAYEIGKEEEVFFAMIAGNLVAGKPPPKKEKDYFLTTAEEQIGYAVSMIPKAPFKTYFINGPRELTFKDKDDGKNVGEVIASLRSDLAYCGDLKTTFDIGNKGYKVVLIHGGNATAYTKSHPLQGVEESFQEAVNYAYEHSAPFQLVLLGGINSYIYLPRRLPIASGKFNDFDSVALPSLCRATGSEKARKKRDASPVLGCVIATLEFDRDGNLAQIVFDVRDLTAYHKNDDFLRDLEFVPRLGEEEKSVLEFLKNKPRRRGEISRFLKKFDSYVDELIERLRQYGYQIEFEVAGNAFRLMRNFKKAAQPLDIKKFYVKSVKVAAIADTHLGHENERPDLLAKTYEISEAEKVDFISHSGDVFEGEDAYPGQVRELIFHGADNQRNHGLEVWPKSKIPTIFVRATSHELAFLKKCGHDIVDTFVKMAPLHGLYNLQYLGDHKGIVEKNGIKIELVHPKSGIPYGVTYKLQKRIEHLVEIAAPSDAKIMLCGHLHVAATMIYKGMVAFLVPCLEDQTGYLSEKDLIPYLGMWIFEVFCDGLNNITRLVSKYIPFEPKAKERIIKL